VILRTLQILQEYESWVSCCIYPCVVGSPWLFPSLSWCLPILIQTFMPPSVLNELGLADKNFFNFRIFCQIVNQPSNRPYISPLACHRLFHPSCICPCAIFVLTGFISPLDPRSLKSLNLRPRDFWIKYRTADNRILHSSSALP
jgi:hypothetical protein